MGVIDAKPDDERESPSFPESMRDVYYHYKAIRFCRAVKDDEVILMPRDPLTYAEVSAYSGLQHDNLASWMIDVIMSIDAIFNSREAKGA